MPSLRENRAPTLDAHRRALAEHLPALAEAGAGGQTIVPTAPAAKCKTTTKLSSPATRSSPPRAPGRAGGTARRSAQTRTIASPSHRYRVSIACEATAPR